MADGRPELKAFDASTEDFMQDDIVPDGRTLHHLITTKDIPG